MTDYRKKLSPSNFESQMLLMMHEAFWTNFDVQEILSIQISSLFCFWAQ